jgi:hypothetical protein
MWLQGTPPMAIGTVAIGIIGLLSLTVWRRMQAVQAAAVKAQQMEQFTEPAKPNPRADSES